MPDLEGGGTPRDLTKDLRTAGVRSAETCGGAVQGGGGISQAKFRR